MACVLVASPEWEARCRAAGEVSSEDQTCCPEWLGLRQLGCQSSQKHLLMLTRTTPCTVAAYPQATFWTTKIAEEQRQQKHAAVLHS